MQVAYWNTEECSLYQLLTELSRSAHPSISANSTTGDAILFGLSVWVPRNPGSTRLGACPNNSRSHCHCRGHCHRSCFKSSVKRWSWRWCCSQYRFLNGSMGIEKLQTPRAYGEWGEEGLCPLTSAVAVAMPLPRNFFFLLQILGLEIAYYGAFWRHVAKISMLQTTYPKSFNIDMLYLVPAHISSVLSIFNLSLFSDIRFSSMNFNGTHTHVRRSLTGPEN